MEKALEREELHKLQKEQDRERRRLRDRQRRQSMSFEEREKHLARRRRNYQLRRQRAETALLDYPHTQRSIATGDRVLPIQFYDIEFPGPVQEQELLKAKSSKTECLEVPTHKLAKFQGRLRLIHLKHLARSFSDPVCELTDDDHRPSKEATAMRNGVSSKGLRLNCIKRLARAFNSSMKETTGQNLHNKTEVEIQLTGSERAQRF